MKKATSVKPSRDSQKVPGQPDTWWYEGKRGIEVYATSNGITTKSRIPWWRLMKSATRCGWKVRRGTPK